MDYSANLWISLIGFPGLHQTFASLSGSHAITSFSLSLKTYHELLWSMEIEQRENTFWIFLPGSDPTQAWLS